MLLAACGAPQGQSAAPDPGLREAAPSAGNSNMPTHQRFRTLEDYLAHLELTQKPVDGPWYREIRPGIYELQTGNLRVLDPADEPKRIFTRAELERELGFPRKD
jgi:hypothetical protein